MAPDTSLTLFNRCERRSCKQRHRGRGPGKVLNIRSVFWFRKVDRHAAGEAEQTLMPSQPFDRLLTMFAAIETREANPCVGVAEVRHTQISDQWADDSCLVIFAK